MITMYCDVCNQLIIGKGVKLRWPDGVRQYMHARCYQIYMEEVMWSQGYEGRPA